MANPVNDFFEDINLPQVNTDIESDLNAALAANMWKLGLIIFIAMLIAFVLGSILAKKLL